MCRAVSTNKNVEKERNAVINTICGELLLLYERSTGTGCNRDIRVAGYLTDYCNNYGMIRAIAFDLPLKRFDMRRRDV